MCRRCKALEPPCKLNIKFGSLSFWELELMNVTVPLIRRGFKENLDCKNVPDHELM